MDIWKWRVNATLRWRLPVTYVLVLRCSFMPFVPMLLKSGMAKRLWTECCHLSSDLLHFCRITDLSKESQICLSSPRNLDACDMSQIKGGKQSQGINRGYLNHLDLWFTDRYMTNHAPHANPAPMLHASRGSRFPSDVGAFYSLTIQKNQSLIHCNKVPKWRHLFYKQDLSEWEMASKQTSSIRLRSTTHGTHAEI